MFDPNDAALVKLFRLLGPGLLRIGGNQVDIVNWNASGAGGSATEIAPADVTKLAAFAKATGWQVIYGINLKTNTPANAASEAAFAAHALGTSLLAFEIGNEPNFYDTEAAYEASFNTYVAAIRARSPPRCSTAPARTRHGAWDAHVRRGREEQRPGDAVDAHLHRQQHHGLDRRHARLQPGQLRDGRGGDRGATSANGIPQWRMTETNSYFHGGAAGVSDVEAASLWSLDYMDGIAAHNGAGVNFHGGTSTQFPLNYSPIVFDGLTPTGVQGVYYGELLWELAGTGTLHTATVTGATGVTAWGIGNNVFVDNKGTTAITATVTLPAAATAAVEYVLTAPSLTSKAITIAGSPVSGAGAFTPAPTHVAVSGTRMTVSVPANSAALVVTQ